MLCKRNSELGLRLNPGRCSFFGSTLRNPLQNCREYEQYNQPLVHKRGDGVAGYHVSLTYGLLRRTMLCTEGPEFKPRFPYFLPLLPWIL